MFRVDPGFQAQNQENIKQNQQLDEALGLDDDFDDLKEDESDETATPG